MVPGFGKAIMEIDDQFEEFSARRDLWIRCLEGNDRNSIFNQINRMIWDAAVFNIINESRRMAPSAGKDRVQLNGMVHNFIDRCFFESQVLAIRRLVDVYPIEGNIKMDVFSLISLLKDMGRYPCILTMSGASSEKDMKNDTTLKFLEKKVLAASDVFKTYVDKFIAHAATPENRQTVDADAINITLGHLQEAHKSICQAANFVDIYLLGRGTHMSFLSRPQFDHFQYIDRPLVVGKENLAKLGEAWRLYEREASAWNRWELEEFRGEFEAAKKVLHQGMAQP